MTKLDGKTLTQITDRILAERGISRLELCKAIGISSASYTGWKNGSQPRDEKVYAIENFLGIRFADYEKSEQLEELRDDLRILLRSASDLPPSSVYALIAQIEKEKERSVLPD